MPIVREHPAHRLWFSCGTACSSPLAFVMMRPRSPGASTRLEGMPGRLLPLSCKVRTAQQPRRQRSCPNATSTGSPTLQYCRIWLPVAGLSRRIARGCYRGWQWSPVRIRGCYESQNSCHPGVGKRQFRLFRAGCGTSPSWQDDLLTESLGAGASGCSRDQVADFG